MVISHICIELLSSTNNRGRHSYQSLLKAAVCCNQFLSDNIKEYLWCQRMVKVSPSFWKQAALPSTSLWFQPMIPHQIYLSKKVSSEGPSYTFLVLSPSTIKSNFQSVWAFTSSFDAKLNWQIIAQWNFKWVCRLCIVNWKESFVWTAADLWLPCATLWTVLCFTLRQCQSRYICLQTCRPGQFWVVQTV